MTISLTSPITGTAQTGLTSPTYTLTSDVAPDVNGRQWAVTALGGTQTGVSSHSISAPFTVTVTRAKNPKGPPPVNADGFMRGNVARNPVVVLTRKGVVPVTGQAPVVMLIRTEISVPAGADNADSVSVRAALSAHIGALSQQSSGIGDTAATGVL